MNILVVYHNTVSPLRSTIEEHLYSLGRYSGQRVHYLNVALHGLPDFVRKHSWDLIVFHTTFLSIRWHPPTFAGAVEEIRGLAGVPGTKIALPQDEFAHTGVLNAFLREFGVDIVFSVSPPTEWPKIYPALQEDGVRIHEVLTGYLDEMSVASLAAPSRIRNRPIDVGYRAYHAQAWLGSHGLLKTQIAEAFQEGGPRHGLRIDISTRQEDTFHGTDWYRFLLRCRYTISVEGGASLLDTDGKLRERTDTFVAEHPDATFAEIETACFPGRDGELQLFALSPRHLEACATRTCQVLVAGRYNGLLVPGRHYLELARDFSNLEEVLQLVRDDKLRAEITEQAYEEVVASGLATYRGFVKTILTTTFGSVPAPATGVASPTYYRMAAMDGVARLRLAKRHGKLKPQVRRALRPAALIRRALEGARRLHRKGREVPRERVVTVTPLAVERDSRTYKQAASLERFGFTSVLCEGQPSNFNGQELPFDLRILEAGPPLTPAPIRSAVHAVGAPARLVHHLWQFYSSYARNYFLTPLRTLPSAPLYYVHSPYYLPAILLKCQLEGAQFVYDAHDFYSRIHQRESLTPTVRYFQQPFYDLLERLSVKYAAEVVTVSKGVADLQEAAFGRPFQLIRNVQDARLEASPPSELRDRLHLSAADFLLVVVGNAKQGQAVEPTLKALRRLPDHVHVAFLGGGHESRGPMVAAHGLSARVHLCGPVKPFEVVPHIRSADAGLVLYFDLSENYRNCLPNGFFQCVSAGLPILHPRLPEMERLAERYGFGVAIDPLDSESVEAGIRALLKPGESRELLQAAANLAARELTWEHEEQVLEALISRVLFRDDLS
ncbi:MAG: hypothetical protein JKY65_01970 [Planctomycetes bacterium]|nr:hypothetical protein [Planctomycetota bacterium]